MLMKDKEGLGECMAVLTEPTERESERHQQGAWSWIETPARAIDKEAGKKVICLWQASKTSVFTFKTFSWASGLRTSAPGCKTLNFLGNTNSFWFSFWTPELHLRHSSSSPCRHRSDFCVLKGSLSLPKATSVCAKVRWITLFDQSLRKREQRSPVHVFLLQALLVDSLFMYFLWGAPFHYEAHWKNSPWVSMAWA